ncbi:MAG: hypothetical protein C5B43_00540 [Verrucomicrobia bacterium]|nr:MAG: hypothetical protein C5B43_00540 [Verrucomicrobiota bacterium]
MPTKKPRLNITLERKTSALLSKLAKKKRKSVSGLATEFIEDALERDEDRILSKIAELRDTREAKTIAHKNVWN